MFAMTSGSGVWPPSRPGYSEVATVLFHLHWRLSSGLAVVQKTAMKPLGLAARGLSEVRSSAGHFLLSPATLLSLVLEGPTMACCCCLAGSVEDEGLEVPA